MNIRIKLTSAIGIKGTVHRAGSTIEVSEKFAKELVTRGKAKVIANDGGPDDGEEVELADMTVAELKKIAQEEGVEGYATMKKGELIQAIEAAEGGE